MESSDRDERMKAIEEELLSIKEKEVWDLIDRPGKNEYGRKLNLIDSKWVFKRKIDEKGNKKFKARLVIRGFKDRNEYELKETFAPVSRIAVIRTALAIINKHDLEVVQLDVKTAFLNGSLEDEVYMTIPEGTDYEQSMRETKVCKLKKTLYSLKVSPKKWNQRFTEEVNKLGLERDINDPCLFTYRKEGIVIFLVLYVDNIILPSNCLEKLNEIKLKLCNIFKMKDLGEPKMYLGMEILRDRKNRIIRLRQSEYTEKVLERFKMKDCKSQSTPMVTRQMTNRENNNLEKIKEREQPCNDCDDSSSTGGYLIKLYGDVVTWRSHKQTQVTLSTCKAEYLEMSETCQELISLDKAIRDITGETLFPVTVWCDNKAAGNCTQMDGCHKLKDFDDEITEIKRKLEEREISGDYVKNCVLDGKVVVKWIAAKENEADIMTKPLPEQSHTHLRNNILNLT